MHAGRLPRPRHSSLSMGHGTILVALSPLVRVVLWMAGALLSFSAMAVSIRVLARGAERHGNSYGASAVSGLL